jgi:hypothetical protein
MCVAIWRIHDPHLLISRIVVQNVTFNKRGIHLFQCTLVYFLKPSTSFILVMSTTRRYEATVHYTLPSLW